MNGGPPVLWFSPKNSVFICYSPFCPSAARSTLSSFSASEYKNRCVRIKAPHISPDPRRHSIRVSPAAADTVPVLSSQLLCRILLTLFQNIRGTVSLDGILLSFFSLSESRAVSTSARNTQTVTVVNDSSFHKLSPVLFFPYLLFT